LGIVSSIVDRTIGVEPTSFSACYVVRSSESSVRINFTFEDRELFSVVSDFEDEPDEGLAVEVFPKTLKAVSIHGKLLFPFIHLVLRRKVEATIEELNELDVAVGVKRAIQDRGGQAVKAGLEMCGPFAESGNGGEPCSLVDADPSPHHRKDRRDKGFLELVSRAGDVVEERFDGVVNLIRDGSVETVVFPQEAIGLGEVWNVVDDRH
jgi:hypothetical protein